MVTTEFTFDCEVPIFMYGRHVADIGYTVYLIGEYNPISKDGNWDVLDIEFQDFENDSHKLSGESFDSAKRQILELHRKLIDRQFDGECDKIEYEWADTIGDAEYEDYKDSVYA